MRKGWNLPATNVFCARARYIIAASLWLAAGVSAATPLDELWLRDPARRQAAEDALVRQGPEAVKPLVAAVTNDRRRRLAEQALRRMGRKAVPALFSLLDDPELDIRAGGLLFQVIGPDSAGLTPELLSCLRGKPRVKRYCGDAIVKLAPAAKRHAELLVQALGDGELEVRVYAAAALGVMGRPGAKAEQALAKGLSAPEPGMRSACAAALGRIGRAPQETREALERAASQDPIPEVRQQAKEALSAIHG